MSLNESISMSYKHNNLMAMRKNYWNDDVSERVRHEKIDFQNLLNELNIYVDANEDDAKFLFFSLPSIVIVKGYALGFSHDSVRQLITQHIKTNKQQLQQKSTLKIQYQM